jgi:hypothetical protein
MTVTKTEVADRLTAALTAALKEELAKLPTGWTRYEVSLALEPRADGSVGLAGGKHHLWREGGGEQGSFFADCDMLIDDGDAGPYGA